MTLATGLIVVAGLAAYANSFSGPFIYDDFLSIPDNLTIRRLSAIGKVLSPPCNGETVSGRPLLNLSFAIDYAIGGTDTRVYHATNLAIHILNGLLLLGVLRRTFCLPVLRSRFGDAALGLALAIVLLWMVHPLQTESITYIAQRAESLAALSYLLVLYHLIRGFQSKQPVVWYVLAVGTCLLGVAIKETMATVPLVVLLYDRTFVSGTFRESFRRRWGLYLGLIASWGLLAGLVWVTGLWRRQAELGAPDVWSYASSQPGVLLYYLRLSVWPHPLCISYDWPVAKTAHAILLPLLAVGLLLALSVWGLARRWPVGFVGAWFFLILAPTSSILTLRQLAFEHRMYLPLAGVVTLVIAGGYLAGVRLVRRGSIGGRVCLGVEAGLVLLATVSLAVLTIERNKAYHSALSIWEDTVQKVPHNPYARSDLGNALIHTDRLADGLEHLEEAVRLKPDYAIGHNNLGAALLKSGRFKEAIEQCEQALRLKPNYPEAHDNWGTALMSLGRLEEAIPHYEAAVRINPNYAQAHYNWATALMGLGRFADAIEQCKLTLQFQPEHPLAQNHWGSALVGQGKLTEALEHFQLAARINSNFAVAHYNWGYVLSALDRPAEAIEHYRRSLEIQPDDAPAHSHLAKALCAVGRTPEAIEHGLQAVRLAPDDVETLRFAASLLASYEVSEGGDPEQAVQLAQHACRLTNHRDVACLDTLAAAYASAGRFDAAVDTAKGAWQMAQAAGQTALAQEIHIRLQLYRDRKPNRKPVVAPAQRPS
jgi:tetratricopeptide (TPR) repeat protein